MNVSYREMKLVDLNGLGHIDRSDYSNKVYVMRKWKLTCEKIEFNHKGFSEKTIEEKIEKFSNMLLNGNHTFIGAYDGVTLIGIAGFEMKPRGKNRDMFDFGPLWIDRNSRRLGIGRELFNISASKAKAMGAEKFYISATPVKSTVDFYLRMGCKVTNDIDEELFEEEPDDIHMERDL